MPGKDDPDADVRRSMKVYRDFDQAQLDAQYNCRAMVPDTDAHVAEWTSLSRRAAADLKCRLDVAYGPTAAERLDIFPATGRSAPVLVFIHGGYWRAMDKVVHRFPALGFVPRGVALVTINYALAPSVRMDEIVRQARSAMAWVWRNATTFGGDPARVHVCGHSAGGHLSAMMLATDWPAFAPDLPPDLVKGGCPISGLYDLEPIRHTYLNADVRLDAAEVARNSPVRLAPRGAIWMAVTCGGLESAEFHRLQRELVAAWRRTGLAVTEVGSPRMHHFNVVTQLARPESPLAAAILRGILDGARTRGSSTSQ
jgi:arylformamidase